MTVAWFRNAGPETALLSIISAYLMWGMVVATPGEGGCQFGAVGVSSDGGSGRFVLEDKLGVLKDKVGMSFGAGAGQAHRRTGSNHASGSADVGDVRTVTARLRGFLYEP